VAAEEAGEIRPVPPTPGVTDLFREQEEIAVRRLEVMHLDVQLGVLAYEQLGEPPATVRLDVDGEAAKLFRRRQ
jgi:hypothetical protein